MFIDYKRDILSNIPSAKEIETNGLPIAEITKLQQKTEELTLHLIEKNKEIETQKKEIENLNKYLTNQKNRGIEKVVKLLMNLPNLKNKILFKLINCSLDYIFLIKIII